MASKRMTDLVRENSKKLGDAAESIALPMNRRSFKNRSDIPTTRIDLEQGQAEDVDDERDPYKRYCPWLIPTIAVLQIVVIILAGSSNSLWLSLCYDPFRRYELWRYITVLLVHVSLAHLLGNLLFELILGLTLETVHGWKRTLGIFLAGVIAGSLAVTVVTPKLYVLGASAGVYGLLAAHLVTLIFNWDQMDCRVIRLACLLTYIGFDILVSYYTASPRISHAGHAGGAVGGFIAAVFFLRNFEVLKWETRFKKIVGGIGLLLFVLVVIFNIALVNQYYSSEFNFNYTDTYINHTVVLFTTDEQFAKERAICSANPECLKVFNDANITLSS